ncbi:MAG: ankyrin repeat domain-containing protein, partial [Bacteroidales bacterium]|nr:ankyrin repeat domain-containing protein [Bacteroidales bacterium]
MMRSGKHLLFIIIIHLTISQLGLGQDSLRWDLLQAVYAGDSLRCDTLLRNGANPNACTPDSVTALMYATDGGRTDIAALLLRYGADPELGSRW